jgi:hypothetical protein
MACRLVPFSDLPLGHCGVRTGKAESKILGKSQGHWWVNAPIRMSGLGRRESGRASGGSAV